MGFTSHTSYKYAISITQSLALLLLLIVGVSIGSDLRGEIMAFYMFLITIGAMAISANFRRKKLFYLASLLFQYVILVLAISFFLVAVTKPAVAAVFLLLSLVTLYGLFGMNTKADRNMFNLARSVTRNILMVLFAVFFSAIFFLMYHHT